MMNLFTPSVNASDAVVDQNRVIRIILFYVITRLRNPMQPSGSCIRFPPIGDFATTANRVIRYIRNDFARIIDNVFVLFS